MLDNILDFIKNFNMDDLIQFVLNLDLLGILSQPLVVAGFVGLGLLAIYQKWRFMIVTALSYAFLYGYLFITFVVIKNSDISSLPTFLLFLSGFFLIASLVVYKYFIRS